jgi:hypothetical protein
MLEDEGLQMKALKCNKENKIRNLLKWLKNLVDV